MSAPVVLSDARLEEMLREMAAKPLPAPYLTAQSIVRLRVDVAHELVARALRLSEVERERDEWREAATIRRAKWRERTEAAERERDEARRMLDKAQHDRATANAEWERAEAAERERDGWKEKAESEWLAADKRGHDNMCHMVAEERAEAAERETARLREALQECAASFTINNERGIDHESIAREFNRRQRVAKAALSTATTPAEGANYEAAYEALLNSGIDWNGHTLDGIRRAARLAVDASHAGAKDNG